MILIAGLGNPGEKYIETRHNLGFNVLDIFSNDSNKINNFSGWKNSKKLLAEINKLEIGAEKIVLAKPQTFMNNSGQAIYKIALNYKIKTEDIWIIHDDIDLPISTIKIVKNRGSAGHRGIESIIKQINSKNFIRFRVGIKPTFGKPKDPDKFVLRKFNQTEKEIIEEVISKTITAVEVAIKKGIDKAMSEFN